MQICICHYEHLPSNLFLQVLAPPDSDNEHSISHNIPIPDAIPDANAPSTPAPPIQFFYPMHSLRTIPTLTLAEMFSAVTPISTVTPEQVLIGPCHQQRDQTHPTCKLVLI